MNPNAFRDRHVHKMKAGGVGMLWRELAKYFPATIGEYLLTETKQLTEIRLRVNRPAQLVYFDREDIFVGEAIDVDCLRKIALRMMEYSYHTYEQELSRGFFTMKNGCRVGVGGSFMVTEEGRCRLKSINSLCIRIAYDVIGCAEELVDSMLDYGLPNTLVLSLPGQGKTTMLRDAARILSQRGYRVGIADERHEIAACVDGVAYYELGPRCDIVDGYSKARAIEMLIRSMNPQIIVTDEIGSVRDCFEIREAARMGVTVLASAHASGIEDFEKGRMGMLLKEGIFRMAALLGNSPGRISCIRKYGVGM